jgi:hypothetical protein
MFSAKKLVDSLHPYERSTLINYICRPYILRIGTELGINWTGEGKLKMPTADLLDYVVKQARLLHKEKQHMQVRIRSQKREIERRAQLAFDFLEKRHEME